MESGRERSVCILYVFRILDGTCPRMFKFLEYLVEGRGIEGLDRCPMKL